jgi:DNA-binding response OmpR family regulator
VLTADSEADEAAACDFANEPGYGDEVLTFVGYLSSMRVLVVEDEPRLARFISRGLGRHGIAVDLAADGEVALQKVYAHPYDVVVLDRDLPVVGGDDVCRRLVASRLPPRILMLTASGGLDDRIEGLNLGADDYLGKPFAFVELVARIRALARRGRGARSSLLACGDVTLDTVSGVTRRAGRLVPLTAKERGVLEALLAADGGFVSPDELLGRLWNEHVDPLSSTVRNTVMRLRQKLGEPPLIQTRPGRGYRLR